jgi:hypothetical protein
MANQQVSNPPSAAYYLTLIGGMDSNRQRIDDCLRSTANAAAFRALKIWYLHTYSFDTKRIEFVGACRWNTRINISTNAHYRCGPTLPNNLTLYTANKLCIHKVLFTMR